MFLYQLTYQDKLARFSYNKSFSLTPNEAAYRFKKGLSLNGAAVTFVCLVP